MNNKQNQEKFIMITVFLNRYYIWLIIIISLVILAVGFFYVLRPAYERMFDLSAQQLPIQEKKLAELEKYQNDLEALGKTIGEFTSTKQTDLDKLKEILPSSSEIANLFAEMEALIESNGFNLSDITFSEPRVIVSAPPIAESQNDDLSNEGKVNQPAEPAVAQPQISTVEISLSISGGGYQAFKNLLNKIQTHLRVLDVTSINFNDINIDETKGEQANYALTLKTYYRP